MVMEAPPTPQCVGREFVRQYYTLLHEAPYYLHRFYNNQSSFIHGGLDHRETKPTVGQKQIHQMIQRLNFRDCHAKISQVDSQATLGNGVVVQVTGELSNSGQPMRRFTQTFVLAAHSPKKYYVHNDIFRYQDMLMSDEDLNHDSERSETEEDTESGDLSQPPQQPPLQTPSFHVVPQQFMTGGQPQMIQPTVNGMVHMDELSNLPPVVPQPVTETPAVVAAQPAPLAVSQPPVPNPPVSQAPQSQIEEPIPVAQDTIENAEDHPEQPTEEVDENLTPAQDGKVEPVTSEPLEEPPSDPLPNEPKTYATLLKGSNPAAGSTHTGISTKSSPTSPPPVQRAEQSTVVLGPGHRLGNGRPTRGATNVRGMGRPSMDRQSTGRPPFGDDSEGDRRRSGQSNSTSSYPDSHQLFVGNLPHHVTDDELKKLFSQFGTVVELRILSKNNNIKSAGPVGNTKVPNYGFITFEDPSSVKSVLDNRPIMLEGHLKLNVEEKKTRNRNDTGGGPRSGPPGGPGGPGEGGMSGRPMNNPPGGRVGPPGSAARGGPGGPGMRGGRGGGSFARGEGGPGGQGGGRGGNMNGNSRAGGGGYAGRRQ